MMMMMMTSVILGPFGNYLVPLMIGSKRVAFPRLEALSFWLTPCAFLILLSSFLLGGFPTGWTGYAPLSIQAGEGMDSYAVAFGLMGISIILAGFNIIVTIICYRAPGMRWSRLPMFVWAMLTTGFLLVLAAPVLVGGMYMIITDRTAQTAFFVDQLGGSSYLYEDLFWFFGHPEVYILALPGFGIVCELLPVFTRKPLFGYKIAAAGLFGVAILSFFVWQHHLFDSGMDPDMRPLFMLTTELISIPTGLIFLVALGTFWQAKLRLTVPMLFAIAFFFNFLFGGISGVFLSDVPADTTAHGSFFVMAHFHYTIMGGLIFAFFGGIYYWLPKVMGFTMNERLGKIHFWTMFIAFNSTFMPLFAVGLLGQPRRVWEYAANLQTLNDWVSISAFCLGGSMCIFIFNFVMSTVIWRRRAPQNPWNARGLEWQIPSPPPIDNFERIPVVLAGPYEYGDPDALPVADLLSAGRRDRRRASPHRNGRLAHPCRRSLPLVATRPLPGPPRRRPSTTRPRSTRAGPVPGWRSARCRSCSARSRSPTSTSSRPTATPSGCRARRPRRRPATAPRSWPWSWSARCSTPWACSGSNPAARATGRGPAWSPCWPASPRSR